MGSFISKSNVGIKNYDVLASTTFKKILSLEKSLKIDSFKYQSKTKSSVTYYDTPDNLLTKAGVLLSEIAQGNDHLLCVEKLSYLPKVFSTSEEKVFVHKIDAKDKPNEQAFYIIGAIRSMFSTEFTIDLGNIIKNIVPKLVVTTTSTNYKAFSGTGFKATLYFEEIMYKNFSTKRIAKELAAKVELSSSVQFMSEYEQFTTLLEKYCKEVMINNEDKYLRAINRTKPLPKVNKKDKEKQKLKDLNKNSDIIEG